MKILVNSLSFQNRDGERWIGVSLNNGHNFALNLKNRGNYDALRVEFKKMPTEAEERVLSLVADACISYMIGDDPETMSYAECATAAELAASRFNWGRKSSGEDEDAERVTALTGAIARFEDFN